MEKKSQALNYWTKW